MVGRGSSTEFISSKLRFKAGDTLYGKLRPNLRKVLRVPFDGVCSTEILPIFPKDTTDGVFLNEVLRSDTLHSHAMQGITGTKMPRTSWAHLKSYTFLLPPLAEQRAIAAVLDSIDGAIERTDDVIASTERLREALLHELLTRGVPGWHSAWKDVPGLGTVPASWEVVRLGDVAEVVMGQSPPGTTCNGIGIGVPLLNGPTEFGPHNPTPAQWTTELRKIASKGDILFCVRGATAGRMNWADRKYAIGRGLAAIKHHNGPKYQRLLRGIMDFKLPALLALVTGSTFPNLSYPQIAHLRLAMPPLEEQLAIAGMLDAVDEAIKRTRSERAGLQALQASASDALLTGRVRVGV